MPLNTQKNTYFFKEFKLDSHRKLLTNIAEGTNVSMTPKAFEVLSHLVKNAGKLVSKAELMEEVWKDSFVEEANLTQTISVLRKTLGENPNQHRFIVTETGKGYRFVAQVTQSNIDTEPPIDSLKTELPETASEVSDVNRNKNRRKVYFYSLVCMLAIFLTTGFYYLWKKPTSPFFETNESNWTKAMSKPLTNRYGGEYFPNLDPEGESFVFAAKVNNNFDIFLRRIEGNKEINLTGNSTDDDTQPAFSPDGKQIAFRSDRDGGGIFLMEETGENPRRICDFGFHPAWSPDGKKLVVSEKGRTKPTHRAESSLWIINVADGEKKKLVGDRNYQPSWSPNGKRIAYWLTTSGGNKRQIATIPVNGGEPNIIKSSATENWNPVWSPDGKFLYYASNQSGSMAFWRVRIDETTGKTFGEAEIVPTPGKYNGHLSFSKDGKRLIYVQMNSKSNLKAVEFDADKKIPKGESYWITRGDFEIHNPRLSPDGKDFVVTLDRLNQEDIVLIDKDGKNLRDLTNDKHFNRYPTWSPDGKKITFTSDRSGIHQIWIMNSDGSDLRQITNNKKPASFPIWSPNGRHLVYRTERIFNYVVEMTNDLDKQTHEKLPTIENLESVVYRDWSPNSEKLTSRWGKGETDIGIGYFSLKTKEYVKLWKGRSSAPRWLPDNQHMIFSYNGKIHTINTETKDINEIANLSESNVGSVGISKDGNILYFTIASDESNIWLLDAR